jgi:hypothetical protein
MIVTRRGYRHNYGAEPKQTQLTGRDGGPIQVEQNLAEREIRDRIRSMILDELLEAAVTLELAGFAPPISTPAGRTRAD